MAKWMKHKFYLHNHGPIDKNEKGKKQSVLSSWDFAIDVGAKLAKSTSPYVLT